MGSRPSPARIPRRSKSGTRTISCGKKCASPSPPMPPTGVQSMTPSVIRPVIAPVSFSPTIKLRAMPRQQHIDSMTKTSDGLGNKPTRAAKSLQRPALASNGPARTNGRHVRIATDMTPHARPVAVRGYISRDDARDDAALEAAFQQTQTYHEGGRRLDAMMRDHQTNMATVYAAYDHEMSESWRRS